MRGFSVKLRAFLNNLHMIIKNYYTYTPSVEEYLTRILYYDPLFTEKIISFADTKRER